MKSGVVLTGHEVKVSPLMTSDSFSLAAVVVGSVVAVGPSGIPRLHDYMNGSVVAQSWNSTTESNFRVFKGK